MKINLSTELATMATSAPFQSNSKRTSSRTRSTSLSTPSTPESTSDTDFLTIFDPPIKSRFSANNFQKASEIIRSIKNPRNKEPRPVFWSDEERILTYELIVAILKYSSFLKDALERSKFYLKNPELGNVGQEELLVLLYDLIERDFVISPDDPPLPDALTMLRDAILASKTKLMAHIAKLRIKHEAATLESLLPKNLRHQHHIDKNPLYFWINLKKVEMIKIISALRSNSLQETRFEDDTLIQENLFNVSKLHPDLIRLHSSKGSMITSMPMFRDGLIIVQDKSACLPVYVMAKALYFKEAIYHRGAGMEQLNPFPAGDPMVPLPPTPDSQPEVEEWYQGILESSVKNFKKPDRIVVTHCGSGRTAAHLALLLSEAVPQYLSRSVNLSTTGTDLVKAIKSKFVFRPPLTVVVFGTPQNKHEEISKYIKKTLGIVNIRLYSDDFINVQSKDPRVKGCGAIFVNPPSSGSALKDPVAYICSEGGDEQILTQFSEFVSSATTNVDNNGNTIAYSPNQAKYLNHALSIANVKLVLYTTCSNLGCENAEVVRVCLDEARRREEARKCQAFANIVMQSQSKIYQDVSFDVVPLDQLMQGYDEASLNDKFVDMYPSSACSGVYMALIRRRDRPVNMGKNPVKEFVASQMKVKDSKMTAWLDNVSLDNDSKYLSGPPSLSTFSTNSVKSFTEEDLARYLFHKLNVEKPVAEATQATLQDNSASSVIPVFETHSKKKGLRKAIVKRVSTPTHSSMQRQTEKFYMGSTTPSNTASGSQTPRSGTRTPVVTILTSGRDIANVKTDSRPSSSRSVASGGSSCPHHHGQVCVCARHAKKFPDLLKSL